MRERTIISRIKKVLPDFDLRVKNVQWVNSDVVSIEIDLTKTTSTVVKPPVIIEEVTEEIVEPIEEDVIPIE